MKPSPSPDLSTMDCQRLPCVFDKLICDQRWLRKILNDGSNVTILLVNLEDIEDMDKWLGEVKGIDEVEGQIKYKIVDVVLIITKGGEIVSCDENFMPTSVLSNAVGRLVSREFRSDEQNNPRIVQVKMNECRINFRLPLPTERPSKVLTMPAGSVDPLRDLHDDIAERLSIRPQLMYAHASIEGSPLRGPLENMYSRMKEDRDSLIDLGLFSIQYERLSERFGVENWLYCVSK